MGGQRDPVFYKECAFFIHDIDYTVVRITTNELLRFVITKVPPLIKFSLIFF